jgi:methionyl-tRNA formyltransferase
MKFRKVDHIILLGGSRILLELSVYLKSINQYRVDVFTSPRQLEDIITKQGSTLRNELDFNAINYVSTDNINTCSNFLNIITDSTIGIGMGEDWSFCKEIIDLFNGRLIDLMGIRLPQYRGGAHYTWQILQGNRIGACNLQVINEKMIQGVFDSGKIIKFKEYFFPASARIPDHYFQHAVMEEIAFIKEFIQEISEEYEFNEFSLQENFTIYFPRLHTLKNAFLDWSWTSSDIERMICAFDTPYAGVTTFLNERMVRIKNARFENNDGPFHPFQSGLIYKIYNNNLYVATINGTIIISEVNNENGIAILNELKIGDRFFTPRSYIEKGMTTKIEY